MVEFPSFLQRFLADFFSEVEGLGFGLHGLAATEGR